MKIEFLQKNCEMNDNLKKILTTKVSKLDKYLDNEIVKVFLKKEGEKCKLEISFYLDKFLVRSEMVGETFYDLIDRVMPKIEAQLVRHKKRLQSKLKQSAFKTPQIFEAEVPDFVAKIEKIKSFEVSKMTPSEAAFEMDLVGHDFYIFLNEDTNHLSVIYRRDNGNFGLLQPK